MTTSRLEKISPFMVMDVLEKANKMEREGIDVIHLEIGEPDFDLPDCIKDAACKALMDGYTHYTNSMGMIELREAICAHYSDMYNVSIDPDQVIVSSGTSPALFALFSVLLEIGDQVIISDPHYACYPNFVKFLGGKVVTVPVYEEDGFQYRPEHIEEKITNKTKGIVINSPSNPTGNLLSADRMEAIAKFSPYIISDEIYHGLVYEGKERSILEFTDRAFVLNGFSKRYAMTGLRLGYLISPKKFIPSIRKIQQNFFISPNSMAQKAGIAALKKADTNEMRETYNKRRKYMLKRLKDMGFKIKVEPTGAFYIFVNFKSISEDSYKLAFDILDKVHIGVAPGIDFGKRGQGYLRFSYANCIDNIAKGMDRLERYIKEL